METNGLTPVARSIGRFLQKAAEIAKASDCVPGPSIPADVSEVLSIEAMDVGSYPTMGPADDTTPGPETPLSTPVAIPGMANCMAQASATTEAICGMLVPTSPAEAPNVTMSRATMGARKGMGYIPAVTVREGIGGRPVI